MITIEQLPLAKLFYQLRKHGLQLGIDDYELALHAIQGGYCGKDIEDVKRLCSTLWVKTESDTRIFESLFLDSLKDSSSTAIENRTSTSNAEINSPSESTRNKDDAGQAKNIEASKNLIDESASSRREDGVRAITRIGFVDENWASPNFRFTNNYFPVTRRQMKQVWRHLRKMVRVGSPIDLDIRLTVEKAARQGVLHELILLPRKVNKAELVLFIDQDGSMIPFKPLIRQLTETVLLGKGHLSRIKVYYFHDYPDEYFYADTARSQAYPVYELVNKFNTLTPVLIVSDAGAARGNYDEYRISRTEKFIETLSSHTKNYAWLNPMPRNRWKGNSAEKISEKVRMFEMSRHGLETAIRILRGQYSNITTE